MCLPSPREIAGEFIDIEDAELPKVYLAQVFLGQVLKNRGS